MTTNCHTHRSAINMVRSIRTPEAFTLAWSSEWQEWTLRFSTVDGVRADYQTPHLDDALGTLWEIVRVTLDGALGKAWATFCADVVSA